MCQNSVGKASRYPEILELGHGRVVFTLQEFFCFTFFSQGEMPGVAGLAWCETMQNLVLSRSAAFGKMLVEARERGGDSRENGWISAPILPALVGCSCEEEREKTAD